MSRSVGVAFNVPMATQVEMVDCARDDDVQIVELPYRGDLSMVVVRSDGADDLPAIEGKVARNYTGWVAPLRPATGSTFAYGYRVNISAALQYLDRLPLVCEFLERHGRNDYRGKLRLILLSPRTNGRW